MSDHEPDIAMVLWIGDECTSSGSFLDQQAAERARRHGEDLVWFRIGGERGVIRDAKTVAQASALFGAVREAGARQVDLGKLQSALGARQALLGKEQAAAALRAVGAAPGPGRAAGEVAKVMEALGREQSKLGAEQARLGEAQTELGEEQRARTGEAFRALAKLVENARAKGLAESAD